MGWLPAAFAATCCARCAALQRVVHVVLRCNVLFMAHVVLRYNVLFCIATAAARCR
jgi:hypothetical protein